MPIRTQSDLPAKEILEKENIFVMDENRAMHQDIRPISIAILNLMPLKEETELQLLRSLSNTPLQVDITFLTVTSHESKHTSMSHLNKFYQTFPDVRDQKFDGDAFYGVTVPQTRALAKRYAGNCTDADLGRMLSHPKHEMRLCALLILKMRMQKALKRRDEAGIEACYALYRRYAAGINNWDLVDLSAPDIVGDYVFYKQNTGIFDDLAASSNLWEQRMAVVATYAFIRKSQAEPTFRIVDKLIQHPHDLIHKACGWMLREVGKRISEDLEYAFLIENDRFKRMPRTMLRYAIERFPETRRAEFLQKKAQKAPGR